jgi:hypothetical protein
MNGHLYCGINNGIVLALKRLTLTPLFVFNAHMHQLYSICPLSFETRLVTCSQDSNDKDNQNISNNKYASEQFANKSLKKTSYIMISVGRALAPSHEDIYLSSNSYRDRVKALKKYANCLILCSWNCTENQ